MAFLDAEGRMLSPAEVTAGGVVVDGDGVARTLHTACNLKGCAKIRNSGFSVKCLKERSP